MFFIKFRQYFAARRLIAFLLCFVLVGCGANNEKGSTNTNSNAGASLYDFAPVKEAGYYSDLRVMPNGEFLVRGKFKDEDANKGGLVYKVEMNNNHQISEITAMDSGKPYNEPINLDRKKLENKSGFRYNKANKEGPHETQSAYT